MAFKLSYECTFAYLLCRSITLELDTRLSDTLRQPMSSNTAWLAERPYGIIFFHIPSRLFPLYRLGGRHSQKTGDPVPQSLNHASKSVVSTKFLSVPVAEIADFLFVLVAIIREIEDGLGVLFSEVVILGKRLFVLATQALEHTIKTGNFFLKLYFPSGLHCWVAFRVGCCRRARKLGWTASLLWRLVSGGRGAVYRPLKATHVLAIVSRCLEAVHALAVVVGGNIVSQCLKAIPIVEVVGRYCWDSGSVVTQGGSLGTVRHGNGIRGVHDWAR